MSTSAKQIPRIARPHVRFAAGRLSPPRDGAYRDARLWAAGAACATQRTQRDIRMKKLTAGLFAVAATALIAGPARAQIPHITPFAFEARAGVAFPTDAMGDDTGPGLALSGSITYHALPLVGVYAGGSFNKFSLDDADGVDVNDSGLDLGARIGIPTPLIPIDPWIKAGVVVHRLKISDSEDDITSDWGTGYEVGAGLGFGFGPVSVTPGVGYVHYNANNGLQADNADFTVSYVKADIGVRIRI
jgi:hypothetical protein